MAAVSPPRVITRDPDGSDVGSPGIKAGARQLTLELEPGLTERFRNLRECVAQGVYARGLKRVAADLDCAPGNLSVGLSDSDTRHVSIDQLERYIEATGDTTPILYLVERFLGDRGATTAAALEKAREAMESLQRLMGQIR